ncbi:hypothetical protein TOPH_03118 [Tolypocladium ophioglossoides CBS 100239]|uniref:Uncharacterized protein n=1 Tax=Tolypocladium ophioglossoides (strain CBS 100239) TaxID=1163406 RepID=A0A0L0NDL9_TOLOC|nr:hypothetical protein TOPH_03118 [Tolypocladium ophioglossoides CBS 100239]
MLAEFDARGPQVAPRVAEDSSTTDHSRDVEEMEMVRGRDADGEKHLGWIGPKKFRGTASLAGAGWHFWAVVLSYWARLTMLFAMAHWPAAYQS